MRKSKFSGEQTAEILRLAKLGTRIKDICASFSGVHHSFVQGVLRRHGVGAPPRKLLVGKKLEAAIGMYQAGASSVKVAKKRGVSPRTVLAALGDAGIPIRGRRKFDSATEKAICSEYPRKRSTLLAREYRCSEALVIDVLRRNNIPIQPKRKLSVGVVRKLPEQYEQMGSCERLAAIHGVCKTTIANRLKEANVILHDSRHTSRRIYTINKDAFNDATACALYWIGFLLADGCVNEFGTLSVNIQWRDRAHLYKLRRFLGSNAPVRIKFGNGSGYKPGAPFASFCIHSTDIVERLREYGVIPRKTGRERLLRCQYSRDIWRGVIDGDGTVSFHKRGYLIVKLYGSYALCSQFRKFVLTLTPSKARVRKSKGIYSFGVCCGPAEIVARWLYCGSSVVLSRKAKVVQRLELQSSSRDTSQI